MKLEKLNKKEVTILDHCVDVSKFIIPESPKQNEQLSNYFSKLISLGIAHQIGDNLYKATADPEDLMKIGNGFGTAVLSDNGIERHAEFVKSGLLGVTPILIFQGLSLVTGQYYLHNINQNIKSLDNKLDKLIDLQREKDISKIKVVLKKVDEFFKKNDYDQYEYNWVRGKIDEIEEYKELCETQINKSRSKLNEFYKQCKSNDYEIQSWDITPKKKWHDILSSDIISELKAELRSKLLIESTVFDFQKMRRSRFKNNQEYNLSEVKRKLIIDEYTKKIKELEKTFRDIKELRTAKTLKKRHKLLTEILNSTEIFYYLNLSVIINYTLSKLHFLKFKILLKLANDEKSFNELNQSISLVSERKISNLYSLTSSFIKSFNNSILGTFETQNININNFNILNEFLEIKKINSIALQYTQELEVIYNNTLNGNLYFTSPDKNPTYLISNQ